jgi:hypothetical protein
MKKLVKDMLDEVEAVDKGNSSNVSEELYLKLE